MFHLTESLSVPTCNVVFMTSNVKISELGVRSSCFVLSFHFRLASLLLFDIFSLSFVARIAICFPFEVFAPTYC